MTGIAVRGPHCQSDQSVKRAKTTRGTQRSLCQNVLCATGSFLLDYPNRGGVLAVKQTMSDLSRNASGGRDTARGLPLRPNPVLQALRKKDAALASVNTALGRTRHPTEPPVDIERAGAAAMDAMWRFVGTKGHQRWRWQAIDSHTGAVLASVFGRRRDAGFLQLKARLEPCGLTRYSTAHWGAYPRHLVPDVQSSGKRTIQKMARTHLT